MPAKATDIGKALEEAFNKSRERLETALNELLEEMKGPAKDAVEDAKKLGILAMNIQVKLLKREITYADAEIAMKAVESGLKSIATRTKKVAVYVAKEQFVKLASDGVKIVGGLLGSFSL